MKKTNQLISLNIFARILLSLIQLVLLTVFATFAGLRLFADYPATTLLVVFIAVCIVGWIVLLRIWQPVAAVLRALNGMMISYQDGDYSGGVVWDRDDELGTLVDAHNQLGQTLRDQRLNLVQRELLLDTMLQNTPVAMLLVADYDVIVFANLAARRLLNLGRKLEGHRLTALLDASSPSLREAIEKGGDGLFTVRQAAGDANGDLEDDEVYHLARSSFLLNGRPHELFLLRQLTAELRRQEVQTWKKVIRVISHELNNSLAPVSSLAGSGIELMRRSQYERLPDILKTIADRTRHLEGFIDGYARFAKLPAPRKEVVAWEKFLTHLQSQIPFTLHLAVNAETAEFDPAQMEQALLNLLKNAHESAPVQVPVQVEVEVRRTHEGWRIDVLDNGSGMSEVVMANALIPFYSTKRSGTGLGLALVREIIEAHGGWIALSNRTHGGLQVSLILPD